MNSAASVRQPSSAASSNVHRSKRAWSGRTRRMSAPSKWQSRNTFCGCAEKSGCQRLSKWIARKSHERKRHDTSAKRSKRALRKSTPRSVARVIATTRSGATSGAGSAAPATTSSGCGSGLSGSGSLGALSGWDTAARRELALVAQLRRLLGVRLFAVLNEDLVDLAEQRVHELALGIRADDLPLAEDRALPHSSSDADVGVLRLTRAIHLAAHDRDLHRYGERAQALLRDLRERDEVDVRATARRARDEREPLIAKAERLEDVEAGLHFHHRILGERDADRVPDAFVEEHAHARGRPDRAREGGARLGHAEMQRVRHEFREAPVRGDHDRHLERLDADDDVVEVEVLEDLDLAHREVDHALRLVAQVARLAVTDRAVVHADTDRRPLLFRLLGDLAHAVLVVDVPGVETQLVDLRVERHERKAVVEVDVRDDGQDRASHDLLQRLAAALVRHRDARDLAPCGLQLLDLADRRVDVVRERRAHRLDGDRCAVADRRAADPDTLRPAARTRSEAAFGKIQIHVHSGAHDTSVRSELISQCGCISVDESPRPRRDRVHAGLHERSDLLDDRFGYRADDLE